MPRGRSVARKAEVEEDEKHAETGSGIGSKRGRNAAGASRSRSTKRTKASTAKTHDAVETKPKAVPVTSRQKAAASRVPEPAVQFNSAGWKPLPVDIRIVPPVGHCVFASHDIPKGTVIVEYLGKLLTHAQGMDSDSNYRFFFTFNGKRYCIDAGEQPKDPNDYARLFTHARTKFNAVAVVVKKDGDRTLKPHMLFVACKDIRAGEELKINYNDNDPETVEAFPWLAQD